MKYIKEHTNIPIPLILSFSNNTKDSLLGCEYILMEKIKGITLSSFLENKNWEELPDTIINQMLNYYKQIKSIKIKEIDKIGCFKENLEISELIFDGPVLNISNNYLEYLNQQFIFVIKESKTIKKFKILGEKLEQIMNDLNKEIKLNPLVNNLNYNDEITISHGDLNSSNILINPNTLDITAILDLEFACHNFDSVEYHFFENWFEKEEDKIKIKQKIESKLNWPKKSEGFEVRKYFNKLLTEADQIGFYVSSWFNEYKNKELAIIYYLDTQFNITMNLMKDAYKYINLIKNYKK